MRIQIDIRTAGAAFCDVDALVGVFAGNEEG